MCSVSDYAVGVAGWLNKEAPRLDNPFTPPPTNMTGVRQWSTGAIFYSILVVTEALGKSGQSRVLDLLLDGNNPNRAGYAGKSAIYST